MSFLVTNCFHWIGFHIVNKLLENGFQVYGINNQSTRNEEHLSMFLGRNSSFSLIKRDEMTKYDVSIIVGTCEFIGEIKAKQVLKITGNETDGNSAIDLTLIKVPLIFGEWMPMNERGMFCNNKYIPFDSEQFSTEAIYIETFAKNLLQWTKSTHLPPVLLAKSSRTLNDETNLENSIYVREDISIDKNIKKVLMHYYQFKEYY